MPICSFIRSFWLTAALLMLADALTTWYALKLGLYEGNPFVLWVMTRLGIQSGLILKVLICVPVVWGMAVISDWGIRHSSRFIRDAGIITLLLTTAFMLAIVSNNLTLILLTID